jgi:hypothetical protein
MPEPLTRVYDPRKDSEPGAHPEDPRFHVETKNPMLLLTDFQRAAGSPIDWHEVVRMANFCDERVEDPTVLDVVPGGKDSR